MAIQTKAAAIASKITLILALAFLIFRAAIIKKSSNITTITGYICLSILGTWRGNTQEQWSPSSNLNLVLMSLQSIVMNEDVYFNEPYIDQEKGSEKGTKLNNGYSNIVRCGTLQFAMIDMLKNPPPEFADIIKMHFYLKKDQIISQVQGWIDKAPDLENNSLYTGLVE